MLLLFLLGLAHGNAFAKEGRYQVVISSLTAKDKFLVDTESGKTWQLVCAYPGASLSGYCEYSIWDPVDAVGINVTNKDVDRVVDMIKKKHSDDAMKQAKPSH